MLHNAPMPYVFKPIPKDWLRVTDSQIFSQSSSTTIQYTTPKYTGVIHWSYSVHYGDLAARFDFNGDTLHACDGNKLHFVLGIPEDMCIRIGKDGWDKFITREYFEMWLQMP